MRTNKHDMTRRSNIPNADTPNALASGWRNISFDEAFKDVTSIATKIPQGEFLLHGKFPVIDQGDSFIAGYSNDELSIWRGKLPVVIFGDHTRAIKFVGFPFVLGADGCKVLLPSAEIHPAFAYYYLQSLNLEAAGYSRHFKFLREARVRYPCYVEQQRIAGLLEQADRLRRTRRYALELSDTLLPAAFLELFGDPVKNPKRFRIERLEDLIQPSRPISYGILMPGPDIPDGVPYVRVTDIQGGHVLASNVRRTTKEIDQAYKRSKLKTGDLLLTIRGHVGRMGVVPTTLDGANITQDTARLATVDALNAYYLMGCLGTEGMQHFMANLTRGAAVQGINLGDVKELPIPVPLPAMQQKFAALVERHEHLRATQREALRQAEHLFLSVLHHAFNQES